VSGFSRTKRLRQTEVEDLYDTIGRNLDVRGLEIAVHDSVLVRSF